MRLRKEPTSKEIVRELASHLNRKRWDEVVFCGFGEPTIKLDIVLDVARWVHRHHKVPLRLETNGHGYLINPRREVVKEISSSHIGKVSVSLNASDKHTYDMICKPIFEKAYTAVIDFIRRAKGSMTVEATAVSIPQVSLEEVRRLAERLGVAFRVRIYESPSEI